MKSREELEQKIEDLKRKNLELAKIASRQSPISDEKTRLVNQLHKRITANPVKIVVGLVEYILYLKGEYRYTPMEYAHWHIDRERDML